MQQYVTSAEKYFQSCLLKMQIVEKLETIAVLQVNTEEQHIVDASQDLI